MGVLLFLIEFNSTKLTHFLLQRKDIINANVEPTDEECEWTSDEDDEIVVSLMQLLKLNFNHFLLIVVKVAAFSISKYFFENALLLILEVFKIMINLSSYNYVANKPATSEYYQKEI